MWFDEFWLQTRIASHPEEEYNTSAWLEASIRLWLMLSSDRQCCPVTKMNKHPRMNDDLEMLFFGWVNTSPILSLR